MQKYNTSDQQHSQILLTLKDGRKVSIVQNFEESNHTVYGKYAHSVEVWVDGDDEPSFNLNAEELMKFLLNKILT